MSPRKRNSSIDRSLPHTGRFTHQSEGLLRLRVDAYDNHRKRPGRNGGTPLGLLSSTTMQPSMSIADYDRFLQGLSDAAVEFECPVVGGSIRERREFAAVGTAIGCCPPDAVLIRSSARLGDIVAVVGTMGVFWADVLSELNNLDIPNEYSDLASQVMKHPTPKIGPGVFFRTGTSRHIMH